MLTLVRKDNSSKNSMFDNTQRKAQLIFALIIGLGVVLSLVVYFATNQVEKTTVTLINQQIPKYQLLRQLHGSLIEQERLLYEYYATLDNQVYQVPFVQSTKQTEELLGVIKDKFKEKQTVTKIWQNQQNIVSLSELLHDNMESINTDWDLSRSILKQISDYGRIIQPDLEKLTNEVRLQVEQSYEQNKVELSNTQQLVILYIVAIITLFIVIGRYIKGYVRESAKSRRLALFPKRNPNPVISLDLNNNITFYNPACEQLVKNLGHGVQHVYELLPADLIKHQRELKTTKDVAKTIEYVVGDKILCCELHWLPDQNAYDVHIQDVTDRKQAEKRLNYLAYHDQTTGLENGFKLNQVLDELTADKKARYFALALIEVRHYNRIVSMQGGDTAAVIIGAIANTLSRRLTQIGANSYCQLFHSSEHAFALVADNLISQEDIETLHGDLSVPLQQPIATEFGKFNVELDFGFCLAPESGRDRNELMKHARAALDHAISMEHINWVVYSDSIGCQIEQYHNLVDKLEFALDSQQLKLSFQPQKNIQTGEVIGMETLIRWQDESGQWISPAEFIPVAEQSGLIIPIGEWILESACRQAMCWYEQGFTNLVVAVNISPRQFQYPEFCEVVQSTLDETGLPAKNLELEITEGVIMYNENETLATLEKLKSLGVQLSIDDFGTGYSSLSYLKRFKIDKLKIDQAFIRQMHVDTKDQAIVKTIVQLGKNLGLTLIAEGVELEEHQTFLQEIGCDEIQGYYFSRPLFSDDFTKFINTKHEN